MVAAVGGELEEIVGVAALLELLLGEEVVIAAVALPLARLPGRRGDRELQVGDAFEQLLDQRSLADPGGAGDDEDLGRLPCIGGRY